MLRLLYHGMDGVVQQAHDGPAEHVRIAMKGHRLCRQSDREADVVLLLLLGEGVVEHFLIPLKHRQEVHIHIAAYAVFQYFSHGFQHVGGRLAVLLHML